MVYNTDINDPIVLTLPKSIVFQKSQAWSTSRITLISWILFLSLFHELTGIIVKFSSLRIFILIIFIAYG